METRDGFIDETFGAAARLYPVPRRVVAPLLAAGVTLGAAGDALLRAPGEPALNLFICIASVAVAALLLHRRAGLTLDRERAAWLAVGVLFAAGLAWRDSSTLKLLALGCAVLTFAIAAHRPATAWVRRAGLMRYAGALVLGALHTWTATALALLDAARLMPRVDRTATGWRRAGAVGRGLLIAAPLVAVFGALLMSADAVFAELVARAVRLDVEWLVPHVVLFAILAWLSTGYLRGFLTGTDLPSFRGAEPEVNGRDVPAPAWLALGATEVTTALGAVNLLFLLFVIVQFRYLFGADSIVQVTPDLTYADYARRGFFELVSAVVLVVPVLLAADWLLDRRTRRDVVVFRALAGLQIALVLAIGASALQRLRLYHASYGLTESRFYAMVLLLWIGAVLLWLAATVLRGRRQMFAFGTLASGLVSIALLFAVNPDAIIARANVARMWTAEAPVRFDVAYATTLSADAVPVLLDTLPALPADVQCPLARHMLRRWSPGEARSLRSWNWSEARASRAVRAQDAALGAMAGPDARCAGRDK